MKRVREPAARHKDDKDEKDDNDDRKGNDTEGQDRHEEGKGASSQAEGEKVKLAILPGGVHLDFT